MPRRKREEVGGDKAEPVTELGEPITTEDTDTEAGEAPEGNASRMAGRENTGD